MRYEPSLPDAMFLAIPVDMSVATMAAFGIAVLLGSKTVPWISPVDFWVKTAAVEMSRKECLHNNLQVAPLFRNRLHRI